jgi:hypothetical protein
MEPIINISYFGGGGGIGIEMVPDTSQMYL